LADCLGNGRTVVPLLDSKQALRNEIVYLLVGDLDGEWRQKGTK
jgi:hypothetical protein